MHRSQPCVLLTGFGPFPTVQANATSLLVPAIAEAARSAFPGVHFECRILPTEWAASFTELDGILGVLKPGLAVHFGVSSRATGFEIETRARNACAMSQDAAGCLPADACVAPVGPDFLPASLPAAHIVSRLRRRGMPAQISRDAGAYLCNAVLYRSLDVARRYGFPQRAGFVHLPSNLVNERRPEREPLRARGLDWKTVIEGSLEIIGASLGRIPATGFLQPGRARLGNIR